MSVQGGLLPSICSQIKKKSELSGKGEEGFRPNWEFFPIIFVFFNYDASLKLPVWNKYRARRVLSAVNIVDIIQICCVPFYSLDGCRNSKLLMPFSIFLHSICYGRVIICYCWQHPTSPWYLSKAAAPLIPSITSITTSMVLVTILTPGLCVHNWLRWDGHALQVLHRQRVALRAEQHYTVQDIIHGMEIQDI